jgi:mono/diheme cytochrome c family protein
VRRLGAAGWGVWLTAVALAASAAACRRGPAPAARDAIQEAFRDGGLTAVEVQGRRLFVAQCATCHGAEGRGDGQNAYNLTPPPPDFQESLARLTPADRRRVVEGGTAALGRSPMCPPHARALSADEIDALVAWLDVTARKPAGPAGNEPMPRPLRRRR